MWGTVAKIFFLAIKMLETFIIDHAAIPNKLRTN
jgi:hypothetical protein